MPAADGVGEERVEEVRSHGLVVAHVLEDRGDLGVGVGDLGGELLAAHELPNARADAGDQHLGVRVTDQGFGLGGLAGAGRGHHDGRRPDAGRDVPGVVVRAQRAHRRAPSVQWVISFAMLSKYTEN